mgnify:CR=1 FL=1
MGRDIALKTQRRGFRFSQEREKELRRSSVCLINPLNKRGVEEKYNPIGWSNSSPISRTTPTPKKAVKRTLKKSIAVFFEFVGGG